MTIPDESESRIAAASAQVRDTASHVVGTAVERVSGAVATARDSATDAYSVASEKLSDAYGTARERTDDAFATARERAAEAYVVAGERIAAATKTATETVQANPIVALVGGLAVGVIAAALLPRSEREASLLAPLGARLGDAVKLAAEAAKEAGIDALGEAGINKDAARTQVSKLVDAALSAAKAGGGAAASAAKGA